MVLPFSAIAGQRYTLTDFWYALIDLIHARGNLGRFHLLLVQPLTLVVFVLALDAAVRDWWGADTRSLATTVAGGRRLLLFAFVVPLLFAVTIPLFRSRSKRSAISCSSFRAFSFCSPMA